MFVTFTPIHRPAPRAGLEGNTVTVLKEDALKDFWKVGAYNIDGQWDEWVAHIDELNGFDGEL